MIVHAHRRDLLSKGDPLANQFSKFEFRLTALFAVKGIDSKPVRNTICVFSESKKPQFARESELSIFFDELAVDFGEPNRNSEIKRGKALESLCWDVDKEIFVDFADSRKIEMSVGNFTIKIPLEQLSMFKEFEYLLTVQQPDKK